MVEQNRLLEEMIARAEVSVKELASSQEQRFSLVSSFRSAKRRLFRILRRRFRQTERLLEVLQRLLELNREIAEGEGEGLDRERREGARKARKR